MAEKRTPTVRSEKHAKGGPVASRFWVLALKHRDQLLFAVLCLIALISMAVYCGRTSHWGADPIELDRQPAHQLDYRIELNSASWIEWSQLPGIGPVLGQRIVEERERNGPFRDASDLKRVKGIGDKRLREMQPYIQTGSFDTLPRTVRDPKPITLSGQ
jgi:competence protein ComEA